MSGCSQLKDIVFDIGDYVELTQNRKGTIHFEGNIKFIGYVYGIELDDPIPGGTDGLLLGVRYFKCRKKRATFVKATKIKSILKPSASTNRIRKALHLPINGKKGGNSSNKKKKSKTQKKHKVNKKRKRKKQAAHKLPTLMQSDSAPIHSSNASSSSIKRKQSKHNKPGLSRSGSSLVSLHNQLSESSKAKTKPNRKRTIKKHRSTDLPAREAAAPRTPRPRNVPPKRRSKSSMKLSKAQRARYIGKYTFGKGRHHNTEIEQIPKDINQRLKYYLKVLSTINPLKKRQEALKQCITILSDAQLSEKQVFSFKVERNSTKTTGKENPSLNSCALKYFVDNFKKPFWRQLEDKKLAIQKEVLHLLHILIKNQWIYIKKHIAYYVKKLMMYFEKNDVKSTRKIIEPIVKLMIKSLAMGDDKVIVVMMVAELIQFATKSRSKMVKKNSWIYIGLLIKKQIKYKTELPSASSSPSYAMGTKKYTFGQSPQNMLDLLQTGLKKGISDSDKSTQAEAMSVLNMYTILDEARAERLISRMSGSAVKQYEKHYVNNKRFTAASSPRASMLTSPRFHSPKSKTVTGLMKKQKKTKPEAQKPKINTTKPIEHKVAHKTATTKQLDVEQITEALHEDKPQIYTFGQITSSTKGDDDFHFEYSSDDYLSSSDSENTYSDDSGDSDDAAPVIRTKKTPMFIPSLSTNDDTDDDGTEETEESQEREHNEMYDTNGNGASAKKKTKRSHIRSMSQGHTRKKNTAAIKTFVPSLDTSMMSKSENIYDRNCNIKPKKSAAIPGRMRPHSARFNSGAKNRLPSLRPNSARMFNQKMVFSAEEEEEEEEEDTIVVLPTVMAMDVESDEDSGSDTSDENMSDDDDDDENEDEDESIRAKDINEFRENVHNGYVPKAHGISYDALLSEYHFDTQMMNETNADDVNDTFLVHPSYSYAHVDTTQILQNLPYPKMQDEDESDDEYESDHKLNTLRARDDAVEDYVSIHLKPSINETNFKGRNKLNLVILLDQSESMGSTFNDEVAGKSKMRIANECLCNLVDKLHDDDRFALISFDDDLFIHTESKLELMCHINKDELKSNIMSIKENGGTNFELAYEKATDLFDDLLHEEKDQDCDNRIIMLTDACPNSAATDPHSLLHLFTDNSTKHIYTTFVGVGLDFNTDMISIIHKQRGCNYASVKTANDFKQILNDDFDCHVTPLVFEVCLKLNCIDDIYGVDEKQRERIKRSGEIQRIETLFPLKRSIESSATKNGMVFIKLKRNNARIRLQIQYKDRNGKIYQRNEYIAVNKTKRSTYYDTIVIRKGILLCRYCRLLKQWMQEDIDSHHNRSFLYVSEKWKNIFAEFMVYFKKEMEVICDSHLEKEMKLLSKLASFVEPQPVNKSSSQNSLSSNATLSSSTLSSATNVDHSDITDVIVSFLELKEPRITWKMIEFFSCEPTSTIFMSFVSRIDLDDKLWTANIEQHIDYTSAISTRDPWHSEDINDIRLTQLSYSLMKMLTNENYAELVRSFLSRKCDLICLHSLAVFHPLSRGNAYHAQAILDSLLSSNSKTFLYILANSAPIRTLLKVALFRNLHHGNMNSFFLDLICFECPSNQKLYKQQTETLHKKLLRMLFEWKLIPYILTQCHSPQNDDNIATKFCMFFSDLTTRCSYVEKCGILFAENCAGLIVDELVGNGLIDAANERSAWRRVQCAQSMIHFLDLCSRPTVFDNKNANDCNECRNIFYSLFEALLYRLHQFMPALSQIIADDAWSQELEAIATPHGIIQHPFGQIRLHCLELLTVAADFAQFECGEALAKIPVVFFPSLLSLTFLHPHNNLFLVHFRRLVHLSMIFRRRILKSLFVEHHMLRRFIDYYNGETLHSDLSAYIVQMLFDFYDHDKLAMEQEEDEDELRANWSDAAQDQWSICTFFEASDLWQKFKSTVIEEIDAQTALIADVPSWDGGQCSKLDDLISSLLRTEDDFVDGKAFREEIDCGCIPSASSLSYFNVLNEYTFDVHRIQERIPNDADHYLCFPSFSFAKSVEMKYFLSVNLNMNGIESASRNKLNLVLLLDVSRSMRCDWIRSEQIDKMKLEYAVEGIRNIVKNLDDEDRIGVITFDEHCDIHQQLCLFQHVDAEKLMRDLYQIIDSEKKKKKENESRHPSTMKSGVDAQNAFHFTTKLFSTLFEKCADHNNEYDNRIIFLSDYVSQSASFLNLIKNCSQDINERICTSFVSLGGCSFNALFVSHLLRIRGCNYYCPLSPVSYLELTKNKNGAFHQMVTPLIYDLCLSLKPFDRNKKCVNCFKHIYGIKNEKKQKLLIQCGEIYKHHTLFLHHRSLKNDMIVVELNDELLLDSAAGDALFDIKFEMSFEDRDGRWYELDEKLSLKCTKKEDCYYDNSAIRKYLLLLRYVAIIKQRIAMQKNGTTTKWKRKLKKFMRHFEQEIEHCNDKQLRRELNVLQKLSNIA